MVQLNNPRQICPQYLEDLQEKCRTRQISPAELTTLCLIPALEQKGNAFQRSPLQNTEPTNSTVMEFLRIYGWKGHTDRIRRALYSWHSGKYPLVLWESIPTPLELLKIQANGRRVITVFMKFSEWEQIHHGKNAWDFTVHDLIHADHFFENPDWRKGQINFYNFILNSWDSEMIRSLKTYCPEQFDYLISDMNSHPQHMHQTLSALCLMAWKKQNGFEIRNKLPPAEESLFQHQLASFFEA